jgi:hypothetical protein
MTDVPGSGEMSWQELRRHAEGHWRLLGPNSQGGTTLYRYRGRLYVVGYGEYSPLPGGSEHVIGVLPDNTPGFPPAMAGGHAAGCAHEPHFGWDWWQHGTLILKVQSDGVRLSEGGRESWSCSLGEFTREGSPRRADVLAKLGPVVLDEAARSAAGRLAR